MNAALTVIEGDIVALDVDAIVNAANERLAPGGGVCGAIFRGAGPGLAEACRNVGPCPTGEVRVTSGFGLRARAIIHAVGPIWQGGGAREDELLAACYRRAIEAASDQGFARIAFPAISTGIYGFPPDRAAPIAVRASADALTRLPRMAEIVFCCFDRTSAERHRAAVAALRQR